ncbi:hypothetical protein [Natrinema salinisoli]|uniref:hypothetical protein n=1 Tax=Natrinema salinisoli TaxID=2878535 RepID=UPI001CF07E16|nr:hypothetical protein [Natrinema salinisoli]
MGIIDRFEEEYLAVSSERASVRELLELFVGAVLFVLGASALAYYLLGRWIALWIAAALVVVFGITLLSQAYWAVTGREDYER